MKINTNFTIFTLKQLAITLSFGATLGFVSCLAQSTLAQTVNPQNGTQNYPSNERDSLTGGSSGINPFDLIHNAQFGTIDMEEFNRNSSQGIEDAAADFKRQQQERLLNQERESTTSDPGTEN